VALLEEIDPRFAPRPGRAARPLVLVLDNGPIYTSKLTTKALSQRPWLTVEWLPRYAPELNDIELAWRDLKRHHLAHRTFTDAQQLEAAIHQSVIDMNRERMKALSCDNLRIAA
jgi:transposase